MPRAIRAANDAVFLQGGELGLGGGELLRVQAPEWRGDGRPRGPQVMQDAVGGVGEPLGGVQNISKLLEEALDCWTVPGGEGRGGVPLRRRGRSWTCRTGRSWTVPGGGGRGGVQPCRRGRSRAGWTGRCWTVPGGGGRGGVQPCRRGKRGGGQGARGGLWARTGALHGQHDGGGRAAVNGVEAKGLTSGGGDQAASGDVHHELVGL